MSVEEARALIFSGACDGLGESRPAMLWQLAMWRKGPPGNQLPSPDASLFPATFDLSRGGDRPPAVPMHLAGDYSKQRRMELERQYLSFPPTDHPLAGWQDELASQDIVRSIDLPKFVGRSVTIAGIVVAMRRAATRNSQLMQFVSLEDRFGLVEVVLFPNAYRELGGAFRGFGPFLVQGMVQENLGSVVLVGQSVRLLTDTDNDGRQPLEYQCHQLLGLENPRVPQDE
jgi:DNA polymerase III alpha subunit